MFAATWADGIADIGELSGGTNSSRALAVSSDGSIIVGESNSNLGREAFRREAGIMTGLGFLSGGDFSLARAVSDDGTIIVGYASSLLGNEAFRWENGTMVGIGDLPGGSYNGIAIGISSNGNIIVGSGRTDIGLQPFLYQNGQMRAYASENSSGQVHGEALGVSDDGSKMVGYISNMGPIMWFDPNDYIVLGDLPGGSSSGVANDITPDGTTVVGWSSSSSDGAFIWDSLNGIRNLRELLITEFGLNLTGWFLDEAVAVSDDGLTIAGNGINPDGKAEGWVARLGDPIPTCQYHLAGDVNDDCIFDLTDFGVMASNWLLNCNFPPAAPSCIPKVN